MNCEMYKERTPLKGILSMADYLVIVESPAKAKTIERYLGKKYKVKASMGHVKGFTEKSARC